MIVVFLVILLAIVVLLSDSPGFREFFPADKEPPDAGPQMGE